VEGKRHIPAAVNRVSVGRVHLGGPFSKEVWRVQAGKVLKVLWGELQASVRPVGKRFMGCSRRISLVVTAVANGETT
jgi:hypothetical protein